MATALPNPDLECSVCIQLFKTPKILSCGHSFCHDCLERWIAGRKGTFPCPICKQDVNIPQGGVGKFPTNFSLKSLTDSTSFNPKHYCPNHSQKEVEYYCQTCNLGLCSTCIYRDHNDHKYSGLELDSTREIVVQDLSKSEQLIKNKIEDLEKTLVTLLETSEKLKSFCDEACTKLGEQTEKIIGELKINCQKRQNEIRDKFDKNESKLSETRRKVITQIENIKTHLDESRPTTEKPSLTLIFSLTKLQDLQKLCENTKTDIPPVTYVEWREGSVKVCDILGSTVTKPLYQSSVGSGTISTVTKSLFQSSEGSGPISTVTKPLNQSSEGNRPISTVTESLYQSSEGSGPISTVPKPLYQSSEGSGPISTKTKRPYQSSEGSGLISTVTKLLYQSREGSGPKLTKTKPLYQSIGGNIFKFNYKDIKRHDVSYQSKDKCSSHGMVWGCNVARCSYNRCVYICNKFLSDDNPGVKCCEIHYTVTILNKDKDKKVSETNTKTFTPNYDMGSEIQIPWSKLTDPSEGFVDNQRQFLVTFDILQVLDTKYE